MVESAQDVLEELSNFIGKRGVAVGSVNKIVPRMNEHPLLAHMGFDPIDADTLSMMSGLDAASLSTQLLGLEMDGSVEMLPGGAYRRLA